MQWGKGQGGELDLIYKYLNLWPFVGLHVRTVIICAEKKKLILVGGMATTEVAVGT
jgi:hypothetical protein